MNRVAFQRFAILLAVVGFSPSFRGAAVDITDLNAAMLVGIIGLVDQIDAE